MSNPDYYRIALWLRSVEKKTVRQMKALSESEKKVVDSLKEEEITLINSSSLDQAMILLEQVNFPQKKETKNYAKIS